jgi:hypothetical protein
MTLFQKIKDIMGLGWTVKFSSFAFQFQILVERQILDGKTFRRESSLPLQDRFNESRIVDCIDWSIKEIEKEMNLQKSVK